MDYSKSVVENYTKNRSHYRSTDKTVFPLAEKQGIKNKVILDFGCGSGIDAIKFVKLGAKKVVGIDPSKAMIDLAKKENYHYKIEYFKTNGRTLPLKNNQFDLVFANFVVHYFINTKQQFKEISRTMKRNGSFLAIFNCLTTDMRYINKKVPMILGKGKFASKIPIVSKSPDEIKSSLKSAGFEIEKFAKIANPDSKIDPSYNNKYKFRKQAYILLAKKT